MSGLLLGLALGLSSSWATASSPGLAEPIGLGADDASAFEADGVFVGPAPLERRLAVPAGVGPVLVRSAAPTGRVRAGDRLFELEAPRLEDRRRELEWALEQVHLQQERARLRRSQTELKSEQGLRDARSALASAERALYEFREIDAPQQRANLDFQLQSWDLGQAEAAAQLALVEAMYEADGRIEEAERIDLSARRRSLERRKGRRADIEASWRILNEDTLPREDAGLELALREARLALRRVEGASSTVGKTQALEIQRERLALRRAARALEDLAEFAESLEWRADHDGAFELVDPALQGYSQGSASPEEPIELKAGLLARLHSLAPAVVRVSVPESRALAIGVGDSATVRPTAAPSVELPATVERVEAFASNGKFVVWLRCTVRHERVLAGWGARVKF